MKKFRDISIGIAVLLIGVAVFYSLVIKKEKVDPSVPTVEDIQFEQECTKYSEGIEKSLLQAECKIIGMNEGCQLPKDTLSKIQTQKENAFNRCLSIKVQDSTK